MGNDVEDEEPSLPPRELVKNSTSSKKKDEAPPKADPSKAKSKKPLSGNEGAIKSKFNNRDTAGPSSTPSGHYKRPLDRHSRQAKGQRKPKTHGKEGESALEEEVEAAEDAALEQEEDDVIVDETPKKSLADYMKELEIAQASLAGNKSTRKVEADANAEKLIKKQEEYLPSSVEKKVKAKQAKEKKFLDFEATFAEPSAPSGPKPSSAPRGRGRGGARGGASSRGRGAPRGKAPRNKDATPKEVKVALNDDKNFPSLA